MAKDRQPMTSYSCLVVAIAVFLVFRSIDDVSFFRPPGGLGYFCVAIRPRRHADRGVRLQPCGFLLGFYNHSSKTYRF